MTDFGQIGRRLGEMAQAVRSRTAAPDDTADLIAEIGQSALTLPLPEWPERLVGRPCPLPPTAWHSACLRDLHGAQGDWRDLDDTTRARLVYHLNSVRRQFGEAEGDGLPQVSIVIPVYNRASMIGQAVESCLAQTAERVEIVIVDDGSSDDLTAALAPYADRIVLRHQENRGISHARRAAIEAASGDFIHFLDSDDVLLPDCIEVKLQAFAAVPDARLCYSGNVGYDPDVVWRAFHFYENPDGGPLCPTTDFLRSIVHRLPFLPSTVMMPRWVLLQIDAFKEGLRRGEDTRLWFQFAKHRPKALGIVGETIVRRYHASSLGKFLDEPTSANSIANVMNLCDLIADPRLWPSTFDYLHGMSLSHVWREINTELAPGLSDWRSRLIAATSAHGGGASPSGLSPLPVLVLMLAGLRSLSDELVSAIPSEFGFHH